MLVAGSRDQSVSKALSQATQISELEQRWAEIRGSLFAQAARALGLPPNGKIFSVRVQTLDPRLPPGRAYFELHASSEEFARTQAWKFSGAIMDRAPRTLAEFRSWWNSLHRGIRVHVPDLRNADSCDASFWLNDDSSPAFQVRSPRDPGNLDCHVMNDQELLTWEGGTFNNIDANVTGFHTPRESMTLAIGTSVSASKELSLSGPSAGKAMKGEVSVRISLGLRAADLHEAALKESFPDWNNGSFDAAFPEIAQVPAELMNIPLANLPARIADLQPKGEQNIEAVGLKIPASDLSRWGTLLVLAIQFYFWLHLNEFNRRIDPKSPGLDVAWIGVYRSRAARLTMIVSACVLPLVTLAMLVARIFPAPAELPTELFKASAQVCVLLVGLCLSLGLMLRLKRLRGGLK